MVENRGAVTVTLTPPANAPSAPLEVSLNRGAFADYISPIEVSADGPFEVVGRLEDLTTFSAEFAGSSSSIEWWFGDGNVFLTGAVPDVLGNDATVQHAYTEPGVYPVTVAVTDSTGLTRLGTYNFIAVYDPSGGFVTGGGWFYNPEGAFTPEDLSDPVVTGKAKFGFSSKYDKGASVPTGKTTFKLDANGFKFKSTSYDWLVVSGGAKAQYQGVGEIKGWDGLYSFRITLRDADGNDSDSFVDDAIRVRIWAEDGTVM